MHQPVNGEAVEFGLTDAGEIRSSNAGVRLSISHRQPLVIECLDDFCSEDRTELAKICIRRVKIGKDIAATTDQLEIVIMASHQASASIT